MTVDPLGNRLAEEIIPRVRHVSRRELDLIGDTADRRIRQTWRAQPRDEVLKEEASSVAGLAAVLGDRTEVQDLHVIFIGTHWFTEFRSLEWRLDVQLSPGRSGYTIQRLGDWNERVPDSVDLEKVQREAFNEAASEAWRIANVLSRTKGRRFSISVEPPHVTRRKRSEAVSKRRATLQTVAALLFGFGAGIVTPALSEAFERVVFDHEPCTRAAFEAGDCAALD